VGWLLLPPENSSRNKALLQLTADDGSEDERDIYESVTCLACRGLHMVNRKTGEVLGSGDE
jgi:hypothetical protein